MARSKNRKSSMSSFSASQVSVPSHLSIWPELKITALPNSQPVPRPDKKVFKNESSYGEFEGFCSAKKEIEMPNRFDCADGSSSSGTETESEYDSAKEAPVKLLEEGPNSLTKAKRNKDGKVEAAAGTETASEDKDPSDSDSDSNSHEAGFTKSTKQDKNQSTPTLSKRPLSIPFKDKLKNAVAEKHNENKKMGVKPSVEGNVFNARSPAIITTTPAMPASADGVSQKWKVQSLSETPDTAPVPRLRTERSNASPPPSTPRRLISQTKNAIPIQVSKGAGPNPPPSEWPSPNKALNAHGPTTAKSTPQLEKKDSSGHRTFSSSIFTKDSGPEPEAADTDAKGRKRKKKKNEVQETGGDVVLAEARKQGARLQELSRLRKIQFPEISLPAKCETSKSQEEDETYDSDEQSSDDNSETDTSPDCDPEKEVETAKDKIRKKRETPKDQEDGQDSRRCKKRRQTDSDDAHEQNVPLNPESTQKSKKRKRDSNSQVDAEVSAKKTKKAKKDAQEKDDQNLQAEEHAAEGPNKKEERRKRLSRVQSDSGTASVKGKLITRSVHSKDIAQADHPGEARIKGKKGSKTKKSRQTNQHQEDDQKSLTMLNVSDSSDRSPLNSPATMLASDTYDQTTMQPDMDRLMNQLKKLLPTSLLRSTVAKLNSDDRSICSERTRLYMKYSKKNLDTCRDRARKDADYTMFDDVTLITAAKDLIILLSVTRLGMDLISDQRASHSSADMSQMELELGRIAIERQWENEKLQEQVRNLQSRIQRVQR